MTLQMRFLLKIHFCKGSLFRLRFFILKAGFSWHDPYLFQLKSYHINNFHWLVFKNIFQSYKILTDSFLEAILKRKVLRLRWCFLILNSKFYFLEFLDFDFNFFFCTIVCNFTLSMTEIWGWWDEKYINQEGGTSSSTFDYNLSKHRKDLFKSQDEIRCQKYQLFYTKNWLVDNTH